jgi:hypothetical protein
MRNIFFKTKEALRISVLNASIPFQWTWQSLPIPPALSIVLLARNVTGRAILGRADPCTLLGGRRSVRVGSVLHTVDAILLALNTIGFPPIQLPARNPLIDSLFLIHLALVDGRSFGLREGYTARWYAYSRNWVDSQFHIRHRLSRSARQPANFSPISITGPLAILDSALITG